jgi:hypothetical protein
MVDRLQDKFEMGEDIDISPSQMRLYMTMFLDQTRAEFEEKSPETVVDQRKQTINITMVEVDKSAGGLNDGNDNGRVVDG